MELRLLGGAQEIGRSAVLVNDRLLLDFGLSTDDPPRLPVGDVDPEAVVVSHGHLDHVGSLPVLLSGTARPSIHWTPPTRDLALRLGRDTLKLHGGSYRCPFVKTDLQRVSEVSVTHGYGEPFAAAGHEVTLYPAGHIPGSAHVLVDDGETRLLYTADFHTDDQRLVAGTTARPDADVVLCESTYADVEHEPREAVEAGFVRRVEQTLWEGGTVVVPAFAIGRTQELLLVCAAHDVPCYVDGMGTEITELLLSYPEYVRDPEALRRAKGHARFVTGRDGQRERIADQPAAIITTSGMLSGGPAMTYLPLVAPDPTNAVTMTGYQVQGTPGRELLETGGAEIDGRRLTASATVEAYDFSAHADRSGLRSFLREYEGAQVLINHGDRCVEFAADLREDGFDASAPALDERIVV
ncbi:MBL fold metallo-hydrolase [Halorubrum vacuolatum]|uniref:Putative mRNA 3-end processing factor n=1 Tax=Halorubrum vacuolatum TaxID=63740 RepID=A0A238WTP1_HALVU|nr:MBL fold metallo-hydrolase [Halorubrum vacuolatum]SNR49916.1 putative mRNA 3-end processing factor [Halorubrum vacuolatum]